MSQRHVPGVVWPLTGASSTSEPGRREDNALAAHTSAAPNTGLQSHLTRRSFLRSSLGTAAVASSVGLSPLIRVRSVRGEESPAGKPSESLVKTLYESLSPAQRQEICFDWDHTDDRGLLRTHVSNNWHITDEEKLNVVGAFFTPDQKELIREIFFSLYSPEWKDRILKQLGDDAGGYGPHQTVALFGTPGTGKFQFVMTGRHLTIRCDGDSAEHVAFGGPIFYGHAASGFNEQPGHPGNVFWPQGQAANGLFKMLDGKQREQALVKVAPPEAKVAFKGKAGLTEGLSIADLSADQKTHAQTILKSLLEPYRLSDRQEALKLLDVQGGLDACRLSYFRQAANGASLDLGDDGEWDVWRLEGPSFVWHYRGVPHVHVWVNVADDASLPLNARG
jgi:hypothetical protein